MLFRSDLQAALDIATHWVEQEPTDVPALFYLSHIALKTHEYELAAETLDKILNIDPTADLEEILAGIAPEQPQDRDILLNALRASKEKNNPSILALIAGLEAQNGLYEQALNNINRALRKRSKSTSFILMKANLLIALQDDEATKDWFAKASRRNKDNLNISYNNLGVIFLKSKKLKEALKYFQEALKFNGEISLTYQNIAIIFSELGDTITSKSYMQKAVEAKKSDLKIFSRYLGTFPYSHYDFKD